jgi:CubicO group peptidase (beta-lactamase class C family)
MKIISTLFILLILFSNSFAQMKTIDLSELETTIEVEMAINKTPGAAVVIISGEKVVFAKGFGTTSSEVENAVTADTLFRLGSTTKMFTAAALVSLADAGKIKLDAPIGNYIKDLPSKISRLTSQQLLSQSSGLRDFAPTIESNDDASLGQNIHLWKDDVFFTEPNKIYSYSSANYWLAGFLTEEIYGKPYSDAVAEIILKPLGMNHSTMRPNEAMTYPLALGHNIKDGKAFVIRPIPNNVAKYPGGSLYSSVNELSRWAIALLNEGKIEGKQVLAPLVVKELPKPQFLLPYEEKVFYGYGLIGYEERGVNIVSHGGVSSGYGSTFDFAPEQKFAVVVLANRNGETLPKTRQKAAEMFLPLKPETNEQPKTLAMNAEEMKRFAGKYMHAPQIWEVFIKDGKLFYKEDGTDFELKRTGKNKFSYEQGEVIFVPNEKGGIEYIFIGLYSARRIK